MSYIVKNCPATYQDFENKFVCTSQIKQNGFPFYCQNCTDCLIKQIAGLCKENKFFSYGAVMLGNGLSADILNLLEIEEVDE